MPPKDARSQGGMSGRGKGRGGSRSANTSDVEGKAPTRGVTRDLKAALSQNGTPTAPRGRGGRGRGNAPRPNGFSAAPRGSSAPPANFNASNPAERFRQLKEQRETERKAAIAQGILVDPDRPRSLADAVTPVGTCPDMCPEYERLMRIQQKDYYPQELVPATVALDRSQHRVDESRMVKAFKRSAAGTDEQLPSDLRPPQVLQNTCKYLFNVLLNEDGQSIESAYVFIWDRSRAIRNDFSIQQLSKLSDIRVAIESMEMIARFHIVTIHQIGGLPKEQRPERYDYYQDLEQLDKTLLSLINYYHNVRNFFRSPNEAEFRAYRIIYQITSPTPNLEDAVQLWPQDLIRDPRVQRALTLYNAAQSTRTKQGPLAPRVSHPVAQANFGRFFKLVKSKQTSFLMACVAEIYFNFVRHNALRAIWKGYRTGGQRASAGWSLVELADILGFDTEHQVRDFLHNYHFNIVQKEDGNWYLDVNSVGTTFPDPVTDKQQPEMSMTIVEPKRRGRTASALINGLSVKAAVEAGMVSSVEGSGHTGRGSANHLFAQGSSSLANGFSSQAALQPPALSQPSSFNSSTPFNFSQSKPTVGLGAGNQQPSGFNFNIQATNSPFAQTTNSKPNRDPDSLFVTGESDEEDGGQKPAISHSLGPTTPNVSLDARTTRATNTTATQGSKAGTTIGHSTIGQSTIGNKPTNSFASQQKSTSFSLSQPTSASPQPTSSASQETSAMGRRKPRTVAAGPVWSGGGADAAKDAFSSLWPGAASTPQPTSDSNQQATGVFQQQSQQPTNIFNQQPQQPTSIFHQQPTNVFNQQPTNVFSQQPTSIFTEQPGSIFSQQPANVFSQQPTSVFAEQPGSIFSQQPTSVFPQQPTSSFSQQPMPTSVFSQQPTSIFSQQPTDVSSQADTTPNPFSKLFSQSQADPPTHTFSNFLSQSAGDSQSSTNLQPQPATTSQPIANFQRQPATEMPTMPPQASADLPAQASSVADAAPVQLSTPSASQAAPAMGTSRPQPPTCHFAPNMSVKEQYMREFAEALANVELPQADRVMDRIDMLLGEEPKEVCTEADKIVNRVMGRVDKLVGSEPKDASTEADKENRVMGPIDKLLRPELKDACIRANDDVERLQAKFDAATEVHERYALRKQLTAAIAARTYSEGRIKEAYLADFEEKERQRKKAEEAEREKSREHYTKIRKEEVMHFLIKDICFHPREPIFGVVPAFFMAECFRIVDEEEANYQKVLEEKRLEEAREAERLEQERERADKKMRFDRLHDAVRRAKADRLRKEAEREGKENMGPVQAAFEARFQALREDEAAYKKKLEDEREESMRASQRNIEELTKKLAKERQEEKDFIANMNPEEIAEIYASGDVNAAFEQALERDRLSKSAPAPAATSNLAAGVQNGNNNGTDRKSVRANRATFLAEARRFSQSVGGITWPTTSPQPGDKRKRADNATDSPEKRSRTASLTQGSDKRKRDDDATGSPEKKSKPEPLTREEMNSVIIGLIRGPPRADGKISSFKNPYFRFKAAGLLPSQLGVKRKVESSPSRFVDGYDMHDYEDRLRRAGDMRPKSKTRSARTTPARPGTSKSAEKITASASASADATPSRPISKQSPQSFFAQSASRSFTPSSSSPAFTQHHDELISQLRAAGEELDEGTTWFQKLIQKFSPKGKGKGKAPAGE